MFVSCNGPNKSRVFKKKKKNLFKNVFYACFLMIGSQEGRVGIFLNKNLLGSGFKRKQTTNSFRPNLFITSVPYKRCLYWLAKMLSYMLKETRAALTTHKFEWLEPWGKLAELELKCSNRELVYVGNTNVTQST